MDESKDLLSRAGYALFPCNESCILIEQEIKKKETDNENENVKGYRGQSSNRGNAKGLCWEEKCFERAKSIWTPWLGRVLNNDNRQTLCLTDSGERIEIKNEKGAKKSCF